MVFYGNKLSAIMWSIHQSPTLITIYPTNKFPLKQQDESQKASCCAWLASECSTPRGVLNCPVAPQGPQPKQSQRAAGCEPGLRNRQWSGEPADPSRAEAQGRHSGFRAEV